MRTAVAALSWATLSACADVAPAPKVLLIGIDGVRVDKLAEAATPNLDGLIERGAFSNAGRTSRETVSGPAWSSMLTGVWPEKHRVFGNDFAGDDYQTYPDFLTRLEQVDPAWRTYVVVDWPPLGSAASNGPLFGAAIDSLVLVDGDALGYGPADSISAVAAAGYLASADIDAAFVYLGDVDVVGHETSSLDPAYVAAIETADRQVGVLLDALARRPSRADEDWLILVSTDHGRRDDGGHGGNSELEETIFVIVSGASAVRGAIEPAPDIVDVAATALTHLGVVIEPSWSLDGRAVGLAGPARP